MITWNGIAPFESPCKLARGFNSDLDDLKPIQVKPRLKTKIAKRRGRPVGLMDSDSKLNKVKNFIKEHQPCSLESIREEFGGYARRAVQVLKERKHIRVVKRGVYEVAA